MTLISVRPADLQAAAEHLDDAAELLARSYQGPDLGVTHHTGSSTRTEVASAATVWTSYLRGLHAAVEGSASALRAAADAYAASEREADVVQRSGWFPW
jgi:hypothetical protein